MNKRTICGVVMAAAIGVSAAACGGTASTPSPVASPTVSPTATATAVATATATASATTTLTASQAADVALGAVPGGAVVAIDPGREQGRSVWDVVVRTSDGAAIELYIDASSGEIVAQGPTRTPVLAQGSAPAITAQAAMATALAAVTGGTVLEADLGREDGRTVWEVLVRNAGGRVEVYIDATTGSIVKQEDA